MKSQDIVVCSFYTNDDYYRGHANSLRKNLDGLHIAHDLLEVEKRPGQDWADICRKKIAFLADACGRYPDKKVFWIDVDCKLLAKPDYVFDFTADLIGFQRGFATPLSIGYQRRTRFWEPCFFGVNTTELGRKFVSDALTFEQTMDIKATDDYFFEEAWRANAAAMSFQVIPSTAVFKPGRVPDHADQPFFMFGESGNVDLFKGKVAQHKSADAGAGVPLRTRVRRKSLTVAKRTERAMPLSFALSVRRFADYTGVTGLLTGGRFGALGDGTGANRERQILLRQMLNAGQNGSRQDVARISATLATGEVLSSIESHAAEAAQSFLHYADRGSDVTIPLTWWARPFPGNFGDWLSPLIIADYTPHNVRFQPPVAAASAPHLISVGSIGRFIKPNSIVVGTGISTDEVQLTDKATYLSVRGPLTASALKRDGGPDVESFGDPGVLMSRLLPAVRDNTNGRTLLVRHFTHAPIQVTLPEDMDEVSVLMSSPARIGEFAALLNRYDKVVTSAMHVMIACHSYGIPCALITFDGFESSVHGSGMKYEDYAKGAGLGRVYNPVPVSADLRKRPYESLLALETISVAKLDEVEAAIIDALSMIESHGN